MSKRLTRSNDRIIGGVCAGLAEHFGLDKTLIRIIWILLFLFAGMGGIVYIILWIVMPQQ